MGPFLANELKLLWMFGSPHVAHGLTYCGKLVVLSWPMVSIYCGGGLVVLWPWSQSVCCHAIFSSSSLCELIRGQGLL